MDRKIDIKKVRKFNMGGEIRGYGAAEPPKTPPIEQTTLATIPMQGAGDAVKSPFADTIGSKSALQSYQDGGEPGAGQGLNSILNPKEGPQERKTFLENVARAEIAADSARKVAEAERLAADSARKVAEAERLAEELHQRRSQGKLDNRSLQEIEADGKAFLADKFTKYQKTVSSFQANNMPKQYDRVEPGAVQFEDIVQGNIYSSLKKFKDNTTGIEYEYDPSKRSKVAAGGPNYNSLVKKSQEKEKDALKIKYGDKFNEELYDKIAEQPYANRKEFIPSGAGQGTMGRINSDQKYISNAGIYDEFQNREQIAKNQISTSYQHEKDIFDAITKRTDMQERLDIMQGSDNFGRVARIESLTLKAEDGGLNIAEAKELTELMNSNEWSEGSAELYEGIHNLNKTLNFDDDFDVEKFTTETKRNANIKNKSHAANDWLTKNLGFVGNMVGESIVSGGDLIRSDGSAVKFWEELTSDKQENLAQAAKELGYDIFNVLSLLTVASGPAGALTKAFFTKLAGGAAAKGLLKSTTVSGFKALKDGWSAWKAVPGWGKGLAIGGSSIAAGAGLAYDYIKDSDLTEAQLAQNASEILAREIYGVNEGEDDFIRRVAKGNINPGESYKDEDDFLVKRGFESMAEAYRYFYRGKEVPQKYLDQENEIELEQEVQDWDNMSLEDFDAMMDDGEGGFYNPTGSTQEIEQEKDKSVVPEQGVVEREIAKKIKSEENSKMQEDSEGNFTLDKEQETELNAELEELENDTSFFYSDEDQILVDQAEGAMERFMSSRK